VGIPLNIYTCDCPATNASAVYTCPANASSTASRSNTSRSTPHPSAAAPSLNSGGGVGGEAHGSGGDGSSPRREERESSRVSRHGHEADAERGRRRREFTATGEEGQASDSRGTRRLRIRAGDHGGDGDVATPTEAAPPRGEPFSDAVPVAPERPTVDGALGSATATASRPLTSHGAPPYPPSRSSREAFAVGLAADPAVDVSSRADNGRASSGGSLDGNRPLRAWTPGLSQRLRASLRTKDSALA